MGSDVLLYETEIEELTCWHISSTYCDRKRQEAHELLFSQFPDEEELGNNSSPSPV